MHTDSRFDGITDPRLTLPAAAHEAGHVIAALAAGFPVREVRIFREGSDFGGNAEVGYSDKPEGDELDHALIVSVAGHEAEAFWLTEYHDYQFLGFRDRSKALHDTRGCAAGDRDIFRSLRRGHRDALTDPAARSRARIVLARHWRSLERLALRLARRHRLTDVSA